MPHRRFNLPNVFHNGTNTRQFVDHEVLGDPSTVSMFDEHSMIDKLLQEMKIVPNFTDLKASFGVWDTTLKFMLHSSGLDKHLRMNNNIKVVRLLNQKCVQELRSKLHPNHWQLSVKNLTAEQTNDFYTVLESVRKTYKDVMVKVDSYLLHPIPRLPTQSFHSSFRNNLYVFRQLVPSWYKMLECWFIIGQLVSSSHLLHFPNIAKQIDDKIKQFRPILETPEEYENWFLAQIPNIDSPPSPATISDENQATTEEYLQEKDISLDVQNLVRSIDQDLENLEMDIELKQKLNELKSKLDDSDSEIDRENDNFLMMNNEYTSGDTKNDSIILDYGTQASGSTEDIEFQDDTKSFDDANDYSDRIRSFEELEDERRIARDEELKAMKAHHVFTITDRPPPTKHVIRSKWIYTKVEHMTPEGNKEIVLKARVAAHGKEQLYRVDHTKTTFTKPERLEVMAFLLAGAQEDWVFNQIIIKNAYFHSQIDFEIYIEQPQYDKNKVWKLNKGILGLKQTQRLGWKAIKAAIQESDYNAIAGHKGIYKRSSSNGATYMLVSDDHIVIGSRNQKHVLKAKEKLMETFEFFDSSFNICFGTNIVRSARKMCVNSRIHSVRLVESFKGMLPRCVDAYEKINIRTTHKTGYPREFENSNDNPSSEIVCVEELTMHNPGEYICTMDDVKLALAVVQYKNKRQLAGILSRKLIPKYQSGLTMLLNIAKISRPDLLPLATFLSQFTKPRNHHWNMLLKAVTYVENTIDAQLTFNSKYTQNNHSHGSRHNKNVTFDCYVDAYAPNYYATVWAVDGCPFSWTVGAIQGNDSDRDRAILTGCSQALRDNKSLKYLLGSLDLLDSSQQMTLHYSGETNVTLLLSCIQSINVGSKIKKQYKDVIIRKEDNIAGLDVVRRCLGISA